MSCSIILNFKNIGSDFTVSRLCPLEQILSAVLNGKTINFPSIEPFSKTVQSVKEECKYHPFLCHWSKEVPLPNGKNFVFILREDTYETTTFDESVLHRNRTGRDLYHYFELFKAEDSRFEEPCLSIRTDFGGEHAEILYIGTQEPFNGNQIKEISDCFLTYLGVKSAYLHDDSKRIVYTTAHNSLKGIHAHPLFLRQLCAVASDDGKSWYEKSGYTIMDCTKAQSKQHKPVTQSTAYYKAALSRVRNTKLPELIDYTKETHGKGTRDLQTLYQKYTPILFREKKVNTLSLLTLHDLGKTLLEASKKGNTPFETNKDLITFQAIALTDYVYKHPISPELSLFNLALGILRSHYIWHKTFTAAPIPAIADPQPLAALIGPLPKSFLTWEKVSAHLETSQKRKLNDFLGITEQSPVKRMRSNEKISSEPIFDEITWLDSPAELMQLCQDLNSFKNTCTKIKDDKWQMWVTIPEKWGSLSQTETYLLIEFTNGCFNFFEEAENFPLASLTFADMPQTIFYQEGQIQKESLLELINLLKNLKQ